MLVVHLLYGMVSCRYHPSCVNMTIEEAKVLDKFLCSDCKPENDMKKSQNTVTTSSLTNGKVSLLLPQFNLFKVYNIPSLFVSHCPFFVLSFFLDGIA